MNTASIVCKIGLSSFCIKELGSTDLDEMLHLCASSQLPTLEDPKTVYKIITDPKAKVLGAFVNKELVGCACMLFNKSKTYVSNGIVQAFPERNCYLCGAYVNQQYRGRGIGGDLYSKRLQTALASKVSPIIVELLGSGHPSSVHPGSRIGHDFHIRAGFLDMGYSTDTDAGKVLMLQTEFEESL